MRRAVLATVATFVLTRLSVGPFLAVLGIEDAISPLRMGIMINVELSFHVLITTAIILDPSVAGENSTTNSESGTWSVTFSYGIVSGVVSCNGLTGVNGTAYPEYSNQIIVGYQNDQKNCWCRMTSPVRSAWVFRLAYETTSDCTSRCVSHCSDVVRDYENYRKAFYATAGN